MQMSDQREVNKERSKNSKEGIFYWGWDSDFVEEGVGHRDSNVLLAKKLDQGLGHNQLAGMSHWINKKLKNYCKQADALAAVLKK